MNLNETYNALLRGSDEFREFVERNKNKSAIEMIKEYRITQDDVIKYMKLFVTNS